MTTVDPSGALHDAKGRFAGHVAGEPDADLANDPDYAGWPSEEPEYEGDLPPYGKPEEPLPDLPEEPLPDISSIESLSRVEAHRGGLAERDVTIGSMPKGDAQTQHFQVQGLRYSVTYYPDQALGDDNYPVRGDYVGELYCTGPDGERHSVRHSPSGAVSGNAPWVAAAQDMVRHIRRDATSKLSRGKKPDRFEHMPAQTRLELEPHEFPAYDRVVIERTYGTGFSVLAEKDGVATRFEGGAEFSDRRLKDLLG